MLCLAYHKISVSRRDSPQAFPKSMFSLLTSARKKAWNAAHPDWMASIHIKSEETELPLGPPSEVEMNLGVTGECLPSAHSVLAIPKRLLPVAKAKLQNLNSCSIKNFPEDDGGQFSLYSESLGANLGFVYSC